MTNIDTDLSGHRLLIVDDTPLNVLLIQKMLGRFRCDIDCAYSGQEALEMIEKSLGEEKSYSLVLLDIKMPEMDGYEVLRRLSLRPETSSIPVIVLSGLATSESVSEAKELGAVDYIQKPVIMANLYDTVLRCLSAE